MGTEGAGITEPRYKIVGRKKVECIKSKSMSRENNMELKKERKAYEDMVQKEELRKSYKEQHRKSWRKQIHPSIQNRIIEKVHI